MKFKNGSGIYQIRNLINHKRYVGSAIDLKNRKRQHFYCLRHGNHKCKHLQNSWNKYGEENFIFEVLEYVEKDKFLLESREEYYIALYQCTNPKNGYNKRNQVNINLGLKHSDESKLKMSKSQKGKHSMPRKEPKSQETRNKLSKSLKGRSTWNKGIPMTEEYKNKWKDSVQDRFRSKKGYKHTEEAKHNMSLSHLGKKQSEELKKWRSETSKGENNPNYGKKIATEDNKQYGIKRKGSSSKYHGVAYVKRNKNWMAYIQYNGEKIYLGKYSKEEDAALAYNKKAIELYGDKAILNIIEEKEE